MNIQCPNCETIFDLPVKQKINNKYKCSVCNHTWIENREKLAKPNIAEMSNVKTILILNLAIFLLVILVFVILRDYLENVDDYWKGLYFLFDMLIPI